MNIIIDTHIFLWLASDKLEFIKIKDLNYIKNVNNNIFISALSIAEIAIKESIGKLKLDGDMIKIIKDMDIEILDFDGNSALMLAKLPLHHRDPFDRMIISQSIVCNYKLLSYDKKFIDYDCPLL